MPPVAPEERLSRFIISKHWIQRKEGTAKHSAFLPLNNEVSVFRTSSITDDAIWNIGESIAANRTPPKTLRGRADIVAENVTGLGLSVIPSEPPLLHANISGYPTEESEIELIALELASMSNLIYNPR